MLICTHVYVLAGKSDTRLAEETPRASCQQRGNPLCRLTEDKPYYDGNCCTENTKCGPGEGTCSLDEQCMDGLVCRSCNDENGDNHCCRTAWEDPGLFVLDINVKT